MSTYPATTSHVRSPLWRRLGRAAAILTAVAVCAAAQASPASAQQQISGPEAVQMYLGRKQYAEVEKTAYQVLWSDMHQPQVMGGLAQALEALKRPEEAAAWYTLMARAASESDLSKTEATKYKTLADRRLAVLDKAWLKKKAEHEKAAAGRKFEAPEKVDDAWTTEATAELKTLHGMYGYKFIGGRPDRPKDWIHNAKGEMQRSGFKLVDELDGRTGVYFICFNPDLKPTAKRPLTNRIAVKNPGDARYLRIGTKGYNFPFILTATAGDREVFSQKIGEKAWSDLKIDLGESRAKGEPVVLVLSRPEGQRPIEGCWFDYIDFFED